MIQTSSGRLASLRSDITSACHGDCQAQQFHPQQYSVNHRHRQQQQPQLQHQQQAAVQQPWPRLAFPSQPGSALQSKTPRQSQSFCQRQVIPMSHDWSQSSMKSESLIHPEDTHWNSGDWSNDQITAIGTHQAYLDPRQLHSGQGQPSQAFNLDTSSLTHGAASPHEFNNALPTSQYASPLHSRTELTSSRSGYHRHQGSRQSTPYDYDSGRDMASLDTDADEEDAEPNEPYNKLLHRCLLQQPNLELLLKDIYEWFRLNTDKGRDPRQKGWQNSIRHNLSMNPVCRQDPA